MLKTFLKTTSYRINVNSVHKIFVRSIFVVAINYKKNFITKFSDLRYMYMYIHGQNEALLGIVFNVPLSNIVVSSKQYTRVLQN